MNVLQELESFYDSFKGVKGYFGVSTEGKLLPYFKVGNDNPKIIVQYAIHGREYVTTYLALKMTEYAEENIKAGTVYFLPVVNPDGVLIALNGNSEYKANANGVDLNVNFDARWGTGVKNVKVKGDANYIGKKPFSEKESRALRDFTLFIKPDATVSYHSKGNEIYWHFYQKETEKDLSIATLIAKETGYKLVNPVGSAGGYKDWCIEKLKIPSFTIEVGDDYLIHPLGKERVDKIFNENKNVPLIILDALRR